MKIIKLLAVVIVHQFLGFLWYGHFFSQPWLAAQGKTIKDIHKEDPTPYIVAIFCTAFFTIVLNSLINRLKITSAFEGAKLGFWVWIGFFFPTVLTHYVFLGFPFLLAAIDSGYNLAGALVAGAILGGWKDKSQVFKTLSI